MYYIKTTTPDKADIKESYEYLGGFNYRNEHGYKSYNEATKHLELEIMSINESCGKHEDVSVTLDSEKGKKAFKTLTESARTELDRMHQIFENSGNIGKYNTGDPESKGKADAEDTEKNNAPFEEKAEATLDKDPKFNGTVEGATPDNEEVTVTDEEMGSDKMKTENSGSEEDFKDAHDDLEGEGVADQHPEGAEAVKMNESVMETEPDFSKPVSFDTADGEEDLAGFDAEEPSDEEDITLDDFSFGNDDEFNGETELDELIREFEETGDIDMSDSSIDASEQVTESECADGCEDILKGDADTLAGDAGEGDSSVQGEKTMDRIDEESDEQEVKGADEKESKIVGPDEVMDGPSGEITPDWERLQESIDRITDAVCEKLAPKKKSAKDVLAEAVDKIVAEEVKKLNAWGKHPRFQKPAFKTPENKEVAPNDVKDWNDDSAKGEAPYGQKIGSSAPFDKQVDMLTDAVMNRIMESFGLKKK